MSVYVDDMKAGFGNMVMCHMVADTSAELLEMADRIGVKRKWIQREGTPNEHFDTCLSKRRLAVKHGAKQLTQRQLAYFVDSKRPEPRYNKDRIIPMTGKPDFEPWNHPDFGKGATEP